MHKAHFTAPRTSLSAVPGSLPTLLRVGREILERGVPEARPDLELLAAAALSTGRASLRAWPAQRISRDAAECCLAWCRARAAGWPFAYLVGRREFWSLEFQVTPDTLVPRPETEHLVDVCLEALPRHGGARIAELGTGCGAVAIALAWERPHWRIQATELSSRALAVARRNAERHGQRLFFRRGDWFRALTGKDFDLLLSNPPYIASDDPCLRRDGLRREPRIALDGGPDGMRAIRHIVFRAPAFLRPGGRLCLEHGATQGRATRDCLRRAGFRRVRTAFDLIGQPRISMGVHPGRRRPLHTAAC